MGVKIGWRIVAFNGPKITDENRDKIEYHLALKIPCTLQFETQLFRRGDRVKVRNSSNESWLHGKVMHEQPIRVKLECENTTRSGRRYKFISQDLHSIEYGTDVNSIQSPKMNITFEAGDKITVIEAFQSQPKTQRWEDIEYLVPGQTLVVTDFKAATITYVGSNGITQFIKHTNFYKIEKIYEEVEDQAEKKFVDCPEM
jgi:hypothetical protein